jgi:NAD(P)-dependent dehydrogenase (short-subunit alcohol dehydrogenase family)
MRSDPDDRSFAGAVAVVTGGGTGMGRELVIQLAAAGASVAMCDLFDDNMQTTESLAHDANPNAQLMRFAADVADPAAMDDFASSVSAVFNTPHINLLFNNAGIGGGSSFVTADRHSWDKTFAVCWGGVYNGCRSFLPMLMAAPWGHVINTSSVNGLWARLPSGPNNAYVAAKFAVRGFTESLVTDFAMHAPHLRASVVHPGHIGTQIVYNSLRAHTTSVDPTSVDPTVDERIRSMSDGFVNTAPVSAAEAAAVILGAVERGEWRILIGDDAAEIDRRIREQPLEVHTQGFVDAMLADGVLRGLG